MTAFTKLPDLIGRNFVVGYFLPALVLLGNIWLVMDAFGRLPDWLVPTGDEPLADTVLVVALGWLTAIGLLAINRPVIQTLEGYPFEKLYGFRWMKKRWQNHFKTYVLPVLAKQQEVDTARARGDEEPETGADHADKLLSAVKNFPHDEEYILPTKFGNVYRAMEVYSHVVYGLDAIPAWGRLQAVMPKEFKDGALEAKSQLEFSVNMEIAGFIGLISYLYLAINTYWFPSYWLPIIMLIIFIFGYFSSFSALEQYGVYVKSAFDLYRKDLAEQLGLDLPRSSSAEREMWTDVSRMMIYRSPAAWDRLLKHRKRGGKSL